MANQKTCTEVSLIFIICVHSTITVLSLSSLLGIFYLDLRLRHLAYVRPRVENCLLVKNETNIHFYWTCHFWFVMLGIEQFNVFCNEVRVLWSLRMFKKSIVSDSDHCLSLNYWFFSQKRKRVNDYFEKDSCRIEGKTSNIKVTLVGFEILGMIEQSLLVVFLVECNILT